MVRCSDKDPLWTQYRREAGSVQHRMSVHNIRGRCHFRQDQSPRPFDHGCCRDPVVLEGNELEHLHNHRVQRVRHRHPQFGQHAGVEILWPLSAVQLVACARGLGIGTFPSPVGHGMRFGDLASAAVSMHRCTPHDQTVFGHSILDQHEPRDWIAQTRRACKLYLGILQRS